MRRDLRDAAWAQRRRRSRDGQCRRRFFGAAFFGAALFSTGFFERDFAGFAAATGSGGGGGFGTGIGYGGTTSPVAITRGAYFAILRWSDWRKMPSDSAAWLMLPA